MSKRLALFLAVALAAVGCTTTKGPTDYKADSTPPIARGDPKAKDADPIRLPPPTNQVSADMIDGSNVYDMTRQMTNDMRDDKKAIPKVAGQ